MTGMLQTKKYEQFKALHQRQGAFVMPNPWNAGTAQMLSGLGFEALATTSAGYAFAVGRRDSAGEWMTVCGTPRQQLIWCLTTRPISGP